MSKSYKKKIQKEEETVVDESSLSKKELYDLNKQKKETLKVKNDKHKAKKKMKSNNKPANLGARIFAVVMLVLMVASVLASALAYFSY